jgi:hypothetical protein
MMMSNFSLGGMVATYYYIHCSLFRVTAGTFGNAVVGIITDLQLNVFELGHAYLQLVNIPFFAPHTAVCCDSWF